MLELVSALQHLGIHAVDGDLGKVVDILFDDESWSARYFVVETGGWLSRRRVLISPIAVQQVDERARTASVGLTRAQLADSPSVDTEMPLSRQMELKYRDYFSWPLYWVDTYLEAYSYDAYPRLAAAENAVRSGREPRKEPLLLGPPKGDPHLRSAAKVLGYAVMAIDGHAGDLQDLIVDTDGWTIRSLVVRASHRGQQVIVLVPPDRVRDVNWATSIVHVNASRREIRQSPSFEPAKRAIPLSGRSPDPRR